MQVVCSFQGIWDTFTKGEWNLMDTGTYLPLQFCVDVHKYIELVSNLPLWFFTALSKSLISTTNHQPISRFHYALFTLKVITQIYRGSYMSALVLLNLLNMLGKSDKM